jgi:signal transduction histidine kinase
MYLLKRMSAFSVWNVLVFIAATNCFSQMQHYTTENGLPSNGIKGLQFDAATGFLWIATEAGISRFNGVDFRTYTKENTPEIASERILFITKNFNKEIFISDLSGNIFKIYKNKPVIWKKPTAKTNPYFSNYYLLPGSEKLFNKKSGSDSNLVFSAVTDKVAAVEDTSLLILHSGILYYQSVSLPKPVPLNLSIKNESFVQLFVIQDQFYVFDNKGNIFQIIMPNFQLKQVSVKDKSGGSLPETEVRKSVFWEMGMENPVIILKGKAWVISKTGEQLFAEIIFDNIPLDVFVKSVQYNRTDNMLFIGTDSKGLIVLKQRKVESKKRLDFSPMNRNSYYSQIELLNSNVLTNEGDIIFGNNTETGPLPVKGKFAYAISWTNDSLLWYTQYSPLYLSNCLHRYNRYTGKTVLFPKMKNEYIVTVSGNRYYLATNSGIGILDQDSFRFVYQYSKTQSENLTFQMIENRPGMLLLAKCNGLLQYNTQTGNLETIFSKENICVRNIWQYKDYIFFGTYGGGFYIYKNGIVKAMPLDKNRYLLYTHCFMPDQNGFCWISTNRGLFKASIEEMVTSFETNNPKIYFHYFGKKDGMDMTELNGGCTPCAIELKNKILSFPTMDGLLWVDPAKANPILPKGEIFIDEIEIDNKKFKEDSLVQTDLPATTADIKISLGYSSWSNKENIYLDYQLNDTLNWKTVNTDQEAAIHLNYLPPGKYLLRIRKRNGFGINNYVYKELRFSIKTFWYKKWWFYLLCTLFAMALIVFFLQLRTRQYKIRQQKLEKQISEKTKELQEKNDVLEKNNSIKTRLISIISHDIVTPLKFLTVAGKNLIEKKKMMSEELQKETILEITNTAQELQFLSTNILNWIKYQNENRRLAKETFSVFELVNQVKGVLNLLANQKNIRLLNEVDHVLTLYQYFEPLKILIYNLILNAINFCENGDVVISGAVNKSNCVLQVRDSGIGMTASQIQNIMSDQYIISSTNIDNKKGNGLGYIIIKDLLKMINATLKIESEKGKGTLVSVIVPL